jgi:hypothetical protein
MGPPLNWRGRFGTRWWPARWSSLHQLSPLTPASPHVELPQTLAGRPPGPLGLRSSPLGPHVKYTPVVMMILTFGQLHFVVP